jgi:hypothetical protein
MSSSLELDEHLVAIDVPDHSAAAAREVATPQPVQSQVRASH